MFVCVSIRFGVCAPWRVCLQGRQDGGFSCLCLRTNVESIRRKSERQACVVQGRTSMGVSKLLWDRWAVGERAIEVYDGVRCVHHL